MIYYVDNDIIWVVAFWDMRMNPEKLKRTIWPKGELLLSFIVYQIPQEPISQIIPQIIWKFRKNLLYLQHRLLALAGERAVLFYEKDVFERLSLWYTNLANP